MAARCSLPARFGFTTTSTTMAATTSRPVSRAPYRQHTTTARPTTAAEGPVSTTRASDAGSPSPNGASGPSAMPTRAYVVPASVAAYATSSVRARPRVTSAIPNTSSTWASAPHTGRSSAGTKSDSGVRSSATHRGSSARTEPTACTGPYPHGWFCTSWNNDVRHTAARVSATARGPRSRRAARTVPNSGPHSRRANPSRAALTAHPRRGRRGAPSGVPLARRRRAAGLVVRCSHRASSVKRAPYGAVRRTPDAGAAAPLPRAGRTGAVSPSRPPRPPRPAGQAVPAAPPRAPRRPGRGGGRAAPRFLPPQ